MKEIRAALVQRLERFMAKLAILVFSIFIISACSSTTNVAVAPNPKIEILHQSALTVIDPTASIDVIAEGFEWTEGPLWIADGEYLLFSDIPNNRIYKYSNAKGQFTYLDPAGATGLVSGDYLAGSNGLLLNDNNQLVVFQQGDRRVAIMDGSLSSPESNFKTLASHYQGLRLNSPNDGVFHSNGNLYFTDPPYGLQLGNQDPRKEIKFNGVYLLKTNGELILLDDQISYPNGIALSKDEKILLVAVSDHDNPHWLAFDVTTAGTLKNKRVFYDSTHLLGQQGEQGFPDGMVVHSSGLIFATGPGGVWLFNEEGKVLAKIKTGQLSSNCTLSADEKQLYVSADDYIMSIDLK